MADSILSPAAADFWHVSYGIASHRKLYRPWGRIVTLPIFYGASRRYNGKIDVYYIENTSEWAGGGIGQYDVYSRAVGVEGVLAGSFSLSDLVFGVMGGRPQVVSKAGGKMNELWRHIKGEIWKMRHTLLPWMHVLIPILGIGIFLLYYSFAAWSDEGKVSGYIQALSVVLPLVISVVCSMSVETEESGHFQTFLGTSVCRWNPLFAKWIFLSGIGLGSVLLAVTGFAAGYGMMTGRTVLSAGDSLILAVTLWLGSGCTYLVHLFLNLAFSKAISLCAGTAELLISALFLTGLGEGRWHFFPCSWSGRWSGYLLLYWKDSNMVSADYLMKSLEICVMVTLIVWGIILWWFHFYEGKKRYD